ncbi:GNAT family N-acetyltransferase [Streptomyces olivaceus]|uniref:peptidogalycan biosysnthesis protein n=1 Tax=Streptomyces olivaceus TaxID=47716 RepID=UPI001CCCC22E|nr:peptidogalycan biosysnthesis protein [Streptomyces olivaceus]MBZ6081327.1 GNAT family N-acetyltransferase [Streptomyces olivaceus]
MEVAEQDRLIIATVNRDEAEDGAWQRLAEPVDIVRLAGSEDLNDADLERLGFVPRPCWVNWVARLSATEEEFTARLSQNERRKIRMGRRFIEGQGLTLSVKVGLTEELLDEFLILYDAQISAMPHGKNFARDRRDRLLAAAAELVSVCIYAGPRMVTGSLWWIRRAQSTLQLRFSASADDARSGQSLRAAYMAALDFARDTGLTFASLGNDPSLFGHVVQPGLFVFKTRFGFTPIPSQILDPHLAGEFADRVETLRSLADPSLMTTWGRCRGALSPWSSDAPSLDLDLLVLSTAQSPGLVDSLRTDSFRETSVLVLP